jgi:hypothetical protein
MDEVEIERTILLGSSAFTLTSDFRLGFTAYDQNNLDIINVARNYPDRFEAWPTLNPIDRDNFDKLRSYHQLGAAGVKLYSGHGFIAPGSSEYLFSALAIDDPSMDRIYSYCAANRLPICLHVNPGPATPGFADEFVSTLERHPQLLVNAPHWILSSIKTERLEEFLDVFPNLVTDISFGTDPLLLAGLRRISRDPGRARRVIGLHSTRFLFGTDFVVTGARRKTINWFRTRVEAYIAMLTCDEYETPLCPSEVLRGLGLPKTILEQIYCANYQAFRHPERERPSPTRGVVWSRFGVPRTTRTPGRRLMPMSGRQGLQ